MGKTNQHEAAEPAEVTDKGNVVPEHVLWRAEHERSLLPFDLYFHVTHTSPEAWPGWVLRELGKACAKRKPWRVLPEAKNLSRVDDWGALPGTTEGNCQRYYFTACLAGRGTTRCGMVVADSQRAVWYWLRDEMRAMEPDVPRDIWPLISRDVRAIRG